MNDAPPRPLSRERLRALAANLALAASSLALVLLLWLAVESALRFFEPRYLDRFALDDINYLHVYSESYGWLPRPGFRMKLGQGPATTINAAGYRGPEYPRTRPPGKRRVVMLGDSIAFGYGVADDETSSRQLERLRADLEVVNLAVQGFGTDQELLRFEREGLGWQPDAAILNFCLANDFRDNGAQRAIYDGVYPKPYFTLEADGRLRLHEEHLRLPPFERLSLFLHQRSILFHALRRLARPGASEAAAAAAAAHPPARELTLALVRRFAEVARAHGVRPIVAVYPNYREFLAPSRRPGRILDAPGLESTTRADLRPLLEARGIDAATFWDYSLDTNFHPNARGHRIVAEVLAELIGSSGHGVSGDRQWSGTVPIE
jgi:lysophospholipase L1-like esterase